MPGRPGPPGVGQIGWRERRRRLALFLGSTMFVLALVGAGELYCRWFTRITLLGNSRDLFVAQRFGRSYGNAPRATGVSFGTAFSTDENGFRIDPAVRDPEAASAVLLLGDSVSFGPGVSEPDTLAGRLRRALPQLRFYNASSIGYAADDYRNVVTHFVPAKPEIRQVLLFFCLNDVYATSAQQIESALAESTAPGAAARERWDPRAAANTVNAWLRSRSKLYLFIKHMFRDTSLIYFRADQAEYLKGQPHVDAALSPLEEIQRELAPAGIRFKVFILPYEAQLRTGLVADLAPQRMVASFLRARQIAHEDTAERFRQADVPSRDLFLYGDPMHLSEAGHALLFRIVHEDLSRATVTR